jgi:sugar phosphate isomerase/epimerase
MTQFITEEVVMTETRRNFFAQSAALWPALGLASQAPAQPASSSAGGNSLHLGIVTYNIAKDWDLDTLLKNLSDTKIEGVELRTTHAHGVEPSLPVEKRSEIRKKFSDSAVRIAGLGTTCEYHSPEPEVLKKQIAATKDWITLAKDVGTSNVKVRPNGLAKNVPEEKSLEQIGKALKECGIFAAENGIRLQLEIHGSETSRVPRIKKILDFADMHPAVWLCWNSNQNDLLDAGFEANFQLLKNRIGQVHMRDLFLEEYPWKRLIQLLQGIKFPGFCLLEIPESNDPLRVLRYARALFRAYQGVA